MRNIKNRAHETNNELSKYKEKERQEYISGSEEYKQKYWTSYIWKLLRNYQLETQVHDPKLTNFSDFRKEHQEFESDIDRFLPGILNDLQSFYGDEGNPLEIIFIFDEQAKKALEIQSNISNNSDQVKNTITTKTEKIEGINISNEELAEKIGDLFYDSLSSFISFLGGKIDNTEIAKLLKEASNHIMEAWKICLPYVSHDFPEMKHTSEVKGLDIDKEELVKRISNLVNSELSDFLLKLSVKIKKDGEADKGRNRIKLSNELFACADNLKQASDLLK